MDKFEKSPSAESALIIYGEPQSVSIPRVDLRGTDTVWMYKFKLCLGENGPILTTATYADSQDIKVSETGILYRILYDGLASDYEDARYLFQAHITKILINKIFS